MPFPILNYSSEANALLLVVHIHIQSVKMEIAATKIIAVSCILMGKDCLQNVL